MSESRLTSVRVNARDDFGIDDRSGDHRGSDARFTSNTMTAKDLRNIYDGRLYALQLSTIELILWRVTLCSDEEMGIHPPHARISNHLCD
jgi:hypothetical protein